jgi:hypothetical protein
MGVKRSSGFQTSIKQNRTGITARRFCETTVRDRQLAFSGKLRARAISATLASILKLSAVARRYRAFRVVSE